MLHVRLVCSRSVIDSSLLYPLKRDIFQKQRREVFDLFAATEFEMQCASSCMPASFKVTSDNIQLLAFAWTRGGLVEWLCSGLQIRVHRFDSGTRLHNML